MAYAIYSKRRPLRASLPRKAKGSQDDDGKASKSTGLGGVKQWVEKKQAQGKGGVGGAVVGGMIAGPLGAMVGAAVGSKFGPTVEKMIGSADEALKDMDDEASRDTSVAQDEKNEKSSGGLKQWVEEKKSQGTGGLGGAVVGGMVAGPLGAVLGAAVGSKAGTLLPAMDDASEGDESAADQSSPAKPSAADSDAAPQAMAGRTSEDALGKAGQVRVAAASVPSARRIKAAQAAFDNTDMILRKTSERRKSMEAEIERLYAKAEDSLATGDEQAARALLASRTELESSLVQVRQLEEDARATRQRQQEQLRLLGVASSQDQSPMSDELQTLKAKVQAKRSEDARGAQQPASQHRPVAASVDELAALKQNLDERRQALKAEAEALYAKAEESLRAGDEQGARKFLSEYQDLKATLAKLESRSDA